MRGKTWKSWEHTAPLARGRLGILFENILEHADDFLERPRSLCPARQAREVAHSSRRDSVVHGQIRERRDVLASPYVGIAVSEMTRLVSSEPPMSRLQP